MQQRNINSRTWST